jgi:hypothetical protein
LAEAFRRLRPQGSDRWNFGDAFGRLESLVEDTKAQPDAPTDPDPTGPAQEASPSSFAHRVFDRTVADRLQPWIEERAAAAAQRATQEALADGLAAMAGGFDATVEAFRFLAARVEGLEDAAGRRRAPVDGVPWLAPPPDLSAWAGPLVRWLSDHGATGEVLHGECGDGTVAAALAEAGLRLRGAEPRGTRAWSAAARGVDVHVGATEELLGALGPGTLGGVVLSGVVDRLPVEDLVALVELATDRLAEGAPLVVVSTSPDAARSGWDAVARDLLPGRPLHPETWALLLARAGYDQVEQLDGTGAQSTYAIGGQRPR